MVLTPDAATILSQLLAKRKKSKADLADLELIVESLSLPANLIRDSRISPSRLLQPLSWKI